MEPMNPPLVDLADQISRIIIPIIIVVGVVSNSFNITVLTRPSLYQHACYCYFIALAGTDLFYSTVFRIYRLLADQYHIDPATTSNVLCKIIVYISHVVIVLAPNFMVLASMDRWCASSTSAQLRKFSNVKVARWMIFLTTVLFALFFTNSAILVDLRYTDPFGCHIRADTIYKKVYVFIQAALTSLIAPCFMAFYVIMTIYNIKKTRVLPATVSRDCRNGNQLVRMLLVQIGTHIILTIPSAVTYLIFVLSNDLKVTPDFFFASMMSVLPFHISFVTAFFLYIISVNVYRKELVQLKNQIFRLVWNTQVYPFINTNNLAPSTRFGRNTMQWKRTIYVCVQHDDIQ